MIQESANTESNNIKIVRLKSGEDILAEYSECADDSVMLSNPMHLFIKRGSLGTAFFVMPWLPTEVIKENIATIYFSDIVTVLEPKDELVEYYIDLVNAKYGDSDEEEDISPIDDVLGMGDKNDPIESMEEESSGDSYVRTLMEQKKRSTIH